MPKIRAWRTALQNRPSVQQAVVADYPQRLQAFLEQRHSYLSTLIQASGFQSQNYAVV
jgi:glutathione S-transferase